MAKDVKFNIKLSIDGKEHVVEASTNVKKLAEELGIAKTKGDELRQALLTATQVTQSFQNVFAGLQQITGLMQEYTAANATQIEAETKLANNMRNTMNARDEDIQSIKDLCAAQQQLGVIGDEVQLAGAQELATYLEKKSSLEKLIPVMNDMVAQQYGLNATQESAANIATMLGKVMDGQVGALSRYGYKFDEAQEQILKFGTEEERAAVLAEVVESAVGGMNAELGKTDAGRAKQMANDFGDLKEQIGAIMEPLQSAIIKVGQLSLAINAISTTSGGIWGVAKALKNLWLTLKATEVAAKMAGISTKWHAMQLKLQRDWALGSALGMRTAAIQANALTIALKGLQIAAGIGIAIAAVTTIISLFSDKTEEATDAMRKAEKEAERAKELQDEMNSAYVNASAALEINKEKLKNLIDAKKSGKDISKEEKKIVGELNDTYGDTMGYFDSVSKWYDALIANSENYCRQMVIEAKTRKLANQIAEKEAETHSLIYDEQGNKKRYSTKRDTRTMATGQVDAGDGKIIPIYMDVEVEGTSELEKVKKQIKDNKAEVADLQKQMQDAVKEAASLEFSVKGSATRPGTGGGKSGGKSVGKSGKKEYKLIENASSYKELANNVSYYQQEIEKTNITDVERIITLAKAKRAAEDAVSAFKNVADAANVPVALNSLDDYDKKLQHLRKQRQTASHEQVANIDTKIAKTEEERKAFELQILQQTAIASLRHEDIKTRDQLNAKMSYYNTLTQQGGEAERKRAQEGIKALNELSDAWDDVITKSQFKLNPATGEVDVSSLSNMKDVDAAISFYTSQQQKEDADHIQQTQVIIDRLTERKKKLQLGIEIPSMQKEIAEINALTGREYKMKIKSMGFDELTEKIYELRRQLADLDNPVTGEQRKDIEQIIATYEKWRSQTINAFSTFKSGWDGIKGVGSGIESITNALEGNGNAWQVVTGIVDGFIQIAEGIQTIISIIDLLTTATTAHTVAKAAESAAIVTATTTQGVEAATQEVAAAAAIPTILANKALTASYVQLASSMYMAAHAYIPFAGFGIGAGFSAAAVALVQAIGLMPFAEGGVVSGPTMALIGEYAGASNNPEVVAPLDKLRSMIEPSVSHVEVTGKIKGRDIVLVQEKEMNHRKRS